MIALHDQRVLRVVGHVRIPGSLVLKRSPTLNQPQRMLPTGVVPVEYVWRVSDLTAVAEVRFG